MIRAAREPQGQPESDRGSQRVTRAATEPQGQPESDKGSQRATRAASHYQRRTEYNLQTESRTIFILVIIKNLADYIAIIMQQ